MSDPQPPEETMLAHADRVIEFIQTFCTLGGSYLGQPFTILPYQRDILEQVYATDDVV